MQLKHIDLIDEPTLGFIKADICFLFIILGLIIFTFLIKNKGSKLSLPKGPNL
jgi:hypothetical protein